MKSTLLFILGLVLVATVWGRAMHPNTTDIGKPFDSCGGNCPSSDCSTCPCGTSSNYVDIASICSQYSAWDQSCCQCIVNAESGGNGNAANENTNGSFDIGVFQINSVNWPTCSGGSAPCDVNTNLACAETIWGYYSSFYLWSTCGGCGCCGSSSS